MQGLFRWVTETATSVYQGVQSVISGVSGVISGTGALLSSPSLRSGLSEWFLQAWQGFRGVVYSSILPPFIALPKTARVLMNGRASGLLRLAPVLLYRAGVRPLVGQAVRAAVSENPLVGQVAVNMLDVAATLYFMRNAVRGFVDNTAYNLAMAKATTDESKQEGLSSNPLVKACEHDGHTDDLGQITASGYSSIYFIGNWLALYAVANSIPYGETVTLPLQMLLYGRAFLEYPLAAAGNCTVHRMEVLNKNNAYAMGMGASYLALDKALRFIIEYSTGVKGYFVDEAVASILTLQFIMTANLNRNTPLPGTEPGIDVFYKSRAVTESLLLDGYQWIDKQFTGPAAGDWYQDLKLNLRGKLNTPVVLGARRLLVDESLQDWDKLALRSTSRLFLEFYAKDMQGAIAWIRALRAERSYQIVNKYSNWMPEFVVTPKDKKMLSLMMLNELEAPLRTWLHYLETVADPEFAPTKVTRNGDGRIEIMDDYGSVPEKPGFYNLNSAAVVPVNDPHRADHVAMIKRMAKHASQPEVMPAGRVEILAREPNVSMPPLEAMPVAVPPPVVRRRTTGFYAGVNQLDKGNETTSMSSETDKMLRAISTPKN